MYSLVCYFNISSLNFHASCFSLVRGCSPSVVSRVLLVNSRGGVGVSWAVSQALELSVSHWVIVVLTRSVWFIVLCFVF